CNLTPSTSASREEMVVPAGFAYVVANSRVARKSKLKTARLTQCFKARFMKKSFVREIVVALLTPRFGAAETRSQSRECSLVPFFSSLLTVLHSNVSDRVPGIVNPDEQKQERGRSNHE